MLIKYLKWFTIIDEIVKIDTEEHLINELVYLRGSLCDLEIITSS